MAKRNKMLYLDEDVLLRLEKEENQSQIVSRVMKEYFDKIDMAGMSEEEIKKQIKILEIQQKANEKILEIQNGK